MNQSTTSRRPSVLKVALLAGLLAGTLDILAACTQYYINTGKGPEKVFQFIASGVFGMKAFSGGTTMILWGFVFHYLIAFIFALIFAWLYTKWSFLGRQPVLSGLVYGIIAWIVMNRLVLPLSQAPSGPFDAKKAAIAMLILMCMIGLPIALVTRRYDPK